MTDTKTPALGELKRYGFAGIFDDVPETLTGPYYLATEADAYRDAAVAAASSEWAANAGHWRGKSCDLENQLSAQAEQIASLAAALDREIEKDRMLKMSGNLSREAVEAALELRGQVKEKDAQIAALVEALKAAVQFLPDNVPRGPEVNGWQNTVDQCERCIKRATSGSAEPSAKLIVHGGLNQESLFIGDYLGDPMTASMYGLFGVRTPALVDEIAVIEWREQVRADSEHVTPWVEWPDLPDYIKQRWREEFKHGYLAAQSNKGSGDGT